MGKPDPLAGPKRFVEDVVRKRGVVRSEERCPACGGERWWTVKLPDGTERRLDCPCFMPEMASWTTMRYDGKLRRCVSETVTTCSLACGRCGKRERVSQETYDEFSRGGHVCASCKESRR